MFFGAFFLVQTNSISVVHNAKTRRLAVSLRVITPCTPFRPKDGEAPHRRHFSSQTICVT